MRIFTAAVVASIHSLVLGAKFHNSQATIDSKGRVESIIRRDAPASEARCYFSSCGCPDEFKQAWCKKKIFLSGWCANSQGNCEGSCRGNWCERERWDVDVERAVNIVFGGSVNEDLQVQNQKELRRPGQIKASSCTASDCSDCTSKEECIYGDDVNGQGLLRLHMDGESGVVSSTAQIWAECLGAENSFVKTLSFEVWQLNNGEFSVYLNGILQKKIQSAKSFKITLSSENHVSMVFKRSNMEEKSDLILKVLAYRANPKADHCMEFKLALKSLSDGSDASYALRNSNELQLDCFERKFEKLSGELAGKCSDWLHELEASEGAPALKALLGAAMPNQADGQAATSLLAQEDAEDCVSPPSQDPESWDCECMDGMVQICGGVDQSCFKNLMCGHPRFCQSWKTQIGCPSSLIEGAVNGTDDLYKTKIAERAQSSGASAANVDDTAKFKCLP